MILILSVGCSSQYEDAGYEVRGVKIYTHADSAEVTCFSGWSSYCSLICNEGVYESDEDLHHIFKISDLDSSSKYRFTISCVLKSNENETCFYESEFTTKE